MSPSKFPNEEEGFHSRNKKWKKNKKEGDAEKNACPEADSCPICFGTFTDQDIGSPECCDHSFCLFCIKEWSLKAKTCPVDRLPFSLLLVREGIHASVSKVLSVKGGGLFEEVGPNLVCEVCSQMGGSRLLVCAGCGIGVHALCTRRNPAATTIAGRWYCRDCHGLEWERNYEPLGTLTSLESHSCDIYDFSCVLRAETSLVKSAPALAPLRLSRPALLTSSGSSAGSEISPLEQSRSPDSSPDVLGSILESQNQLHSSHHSMRSSSTYAFRQCPQSPGGSSSSGGTSPRGGSPPCTPPHHVASFSGGTSPSRLRDSPTSADLSVPFLMDASLTLKESLAIHGKTPPKKAPASINEDDVDIYSDIESIPDNADFNDVDSTSFPLLSDLTSHSNTADLSNTHGESEHDSSENDLVIDEDTPLEHDHLPQESTETQCAALPQKTTSLLSPNNNNCAIQMDEDFNPNHLASNDFSLGVDGSITEEHLNENNLASPCSSPHSSCANDDGDGEFKNLPRDNSNIGQLQANQKAEIDLGNVDDLISNRSTSNETDIIADEAPNLDNLPSPCSSPNTEFGNNDEKFLPHDIAWSSSFDEPEASLCAEASFLNQVSLKSPPLLNISSSSYILDLDNPAHIVEDGSAAASVSDKQNHSQCKDSSNSYVFKKTLVKKANDSDSPLDSTFSTKSHFEETGKISSKIDMIQEGSEIPLCSKTLFETLSQNGEGLNNESFPSQKSTNSETPVTSTVSIESLSDEESSLTKESPRSQGNSDAAFTPVVSIESLSPKSDNLSRYSSPFKEINIIHPLKHVLSIKEMESITLVVDELTSQASKVFTDSLSEKNYKETEICETLNEVVLTVTAQEESNQNHIDGCEHVENIFKDMPSNNNEVIKHLDEAGKLTENNFSSDIRLPETEDISDTEDEPFPLEDPLPEEDEREEGEIVEVEEIKEHPKSKKKICKKHHRESHDHKNFHSSKALSEKSGDSGEQEQIEFKTKGFEKYSLALADEPSASWKRLSKSNKERSYRNGKPKDEEILFKEREIKKKHNKKAIKQESKKKKEPCDHKQKKHSKSRKNESKKSLSQERSRSRNRLKLNSKHHERSRSREVRRTRYPSKGRSRSRPRHRAHSSSRSDWKSWNRTRGRSVSRNHSYGRSQSRNQSYERSRSRNRSYDRSRSRERHYRRSRSRIKSYERSRSPSYERSRSRNQSHPRSRSWNRNSKHSRSRNRNVQRSRSGNQKRRYRSYDRSRSRNRSAEKYKYKSRERSFSRNKSVERNHKGHTKSKYSKDDRSYSRSTSREHSSSRHHKDRPRSKAHRSKSKEKVKGKVTKKTLVEQNAKSKSKMEPSPWPKSLASAVEDFPKYKIFATTKNPSKKKKGANPDQEDNEEPINKVCDGLHHKVIKKKHDKHHALKHNGEKRAKKKKKHICPHDHARKKERNISTIDSALKIELEKHEPCSKSEFYADTLISKLEQQSNKQVNNLDSTHSNAFESKEIYAKGDSIIINLSFNNANREGSKEEVSELKVTSTNHQEISSPLEEESCLNTDKKTSLTSRENVGTSSTEDHEAPSSPNLDDIFWKSAPSPDDSLSKNEENGNAVKEIGKEEEPSGADSPKVDLSPPSVSSGECYDPCEPTLSPQIGDQSPEEEEPPTTTHPPPLSTDALSLLPNALAYLAQLKPSMLPTPPKGGPPLHAVLPAATHPPATAAELLHAAFPALRPPEAKRKASNMASVAPLKRTKFENDFDKLAQPSELSLKVNNDVATNLKANEKFLQKLNRQERVIEEVKMVLKPFYNKREIDKDDYKQILRKSVPKICHNKSRDINPMKIKHLVEGYVKKYKYLRKKLQKQQIEY